LGFLAPHIKPDYECLYYNSLPFAEDIRQYSFSSLAPDKARKSVAPTAQQLQAAEKLINDMDLMHNEEREDGSLGESLKPKYTYNPVLQRFYQCVQFRALNPDSNLPKLDPLIEK
jgi:ATP-dependent DNA helicase 2 subunit 2